MAEFRMPALGADMTAGTLLEWRVAPGDAVHRGDIVAVVDTSKAEIEIEIFEDGVVEELLVPVGTRVPVGEPLARIASAATSAAAPAPDVPADVPAPAPAAPSSPPPPPPPPPPSSPSSPPPPSSPSSPPPPSSPSSPPPPRTSAPERLPEPVADGRPRVSPVARRVAAAAGIDPATVRGTGIGGAVTRTDVEQAVGARALADLPTSPTPTQAAPASTADAPSVPVAGPRAGRIDPEQRSAALRHAVGELMARSKREIPHYYLETAIDLGPATDWLAAHNATLPPPARVIPSALLLCATARALRAVPQFNGFFADGELRVSERIHLGVAVALRGGGLVAPAIHDADRLGPDALMAALADLTTRARGSQLRGSEMADPTCTVTNLGERGADEVLGVIYPPQVALVGFGAIRERAWAIDGMLAARPVVVATLAADHRASAGHEGSRLLAEIDRLLQAPEEL